MHRELDETVDERMGVLESKGEADLEAAIRRRLDRGEEGFDRLIDSANLRE